MTEILNLSKPSNDLQDALEAARGLQDLLKNNKHIVQVYPDSVHVSPEAFSSLTLHSEADIELSSSRQADGKRLFIHASCMINDRKYITVY